MRVLSFVLFLLLLAAPVFYFRQKAISPSANSGADTSSAIQYIAQHLVPLMDSVYNVLPEDSIDFREHRDYIKWPKEEGIHSGLFALPVKHTKRYYSYSHSWGFMEYKDQKSARAAFKKIVRIFNEIQSQGWEVAEKCKTQPGVPVAYNLIPKGGIMFVLKDNVIIEHTNRWDQGEKFQEEQEDFIIDRLFEGKKPDTTYFVRMGSELVIR